MFGTEDEEVESEDFLSRFDKYNEFTVEEWEALKKKKESREIDRYEDGLLAYMEKDKDS